MLSVYLFLLGAYGVLHGIKIITIKFLGILFKTYTATQEYILIIFVFNLFEGILLLFFLTVSIFTDNDLILKLFMPVLALVISYRMFRALMLGLRESKYSVFYLLLFFTTVEILPIVFLVKVMMKFFPA